MPARDIFLNLSPLDHRYYLANREEFDSLGEDLSDAGAVRAMLDVELALLRTHLRDRGLYTEDLDKTLTSAARQVTAENVQAEEEKTRHNVRALVNVLKRGLPADISPFVHLGATSVDILDTSMSLRVRSSYRCVILPLIKSLLGRLAELAREHAETVQIGRTHGQYAVPVTFGYAMAEYLSRLGKSYLRMEQLSSDLRGKLSGAVGAYNAMSMLCSDPRDFERRVLAELDLEPSDHSTQLVEPEYLLRLLAETNVAFGIIANLADDLRNLQRSEIAEVRERFASSQVGSSTMPQKRNPWNSEHVKSLWKAFAPRLTSFYMDQISEHQRDLTNSASSRFVVDYLAGFVAAANRMKAVLAGLEVRTEKMAENLGRAGDLILAEPAYILGSIAGRSEAHEEIRRATLEAEKEGVPLLTALKRNPDLIASISEVFPPGSDPEAFFSDATAYTGLSSRRAREIADEWKERLSASEA